MVRSSLGIATAVGALVVLLLLVSCGGGERPATATPAEDAPQRILIIVTSGLAGDDATAIVAGFAADRPETVVFGRHYATAPDTARSLTGLLTGYPFAAEPGAAPRPSLGELFSRLGYRTYALVEDGAVDRQLAPGFEEWNDGLDGADPIPQLADALARRAPSVGLVYLAGPDSLAPLSSGLAELPGYDRTLVVLTSDHGEPDPAAPVERGFRDSVVRVPLLVKFPAGGKPETVPSRTGSITSSIDLLPSLLALAGKDISGALPGSNVLDGYFSGSAFITAGDAWAFVQDNHKVVVRGEKAWVFDLAADPAETEDLTASRPDLARGLLKMAVEMRGSLSTDAVSAVDEGMDEETLEHLRSLGYIQ